VGGDEAIHGILDMMNAGATYPVLQWAVPIHPTVSELIPTVLGNLKHSELRLLIAGLNPTIDELVRRAPLC
jgi:hypothetical protein